jgi:hypothetical protein
VNAACFLGCTHINIVLEKVQMGAFGLLSKDGLMHNVKG